MFKAKQYVTVFTEEIPKEALQNQGFCSISKPERLRNRSIPNAFGIHGFQSRENAAIGQQNGFAYPSYKFKENF